ncbi:serine/threonine protein kinase [Romboutsia ilealis]|uniref:non-specific serine/threonine protein kinase n=1 Tax=Romboutsia faecis TaxID=2764597 RepID=A0ABR7JK14_9FIRM|nr:protein kinase [Romboutsia faecis]MBC5995237.1 protein kinase [Romboutsia faecis]MRN24514.1 serine/threonine protein kinase [Romboutsia ilealis]
MQFIGNRYEILNYGNEIQVGKLYTARDTYYNRTVYLKLIKNVENLRIGFMPDLIDESTVLSQINSEHIGKLLHIDVHCTEYDVYYYIVSEYFKGESLKSFIYNNILDRNTIASLAMNIVKSLEIANVNHLYHGSLDPNNIFIDENKNIKIFDFGITKANKGVNLRFNKERSYLCPHQLNIDYTDKESDFFSMGIILFEMVFRELPFGYAYNDKEMLKQVDKGVRWSLLEYDKSLEDIVTIIRKLLSRDNKYKTTQEIVIDLSRIIYEDVQVEEENSEYYEEQEINIKNVNLKRKLLTSMLVLFLAIMIVLSFI